MQRRHLGLIASSLFGLGLATPAAAQLPRNAGTLLDILNTARDLTRFAELVTEAGLQGEFAKPGAFSLFVPHDAAFLDAAAGRLNAALRSPDTRRRFLLNHLSTFTGQVIPGGARNEGSDNDAQFRSLAGLPMRLTQRSGGLPDINGARIYIANVRATNGIAHCIDGILWG